MGSADKGKGRVAFSTADDDSSVNVVHIGANGDEEDADLGMQTRRWCSVKLSLLSIL